MPTTWSSRKLRTQRMTVNASLLTTYRSIHTLPTRQLRWTSTLWMLFKVVGLLQKWAMEGMKIYALHSTQLQYQNLDFEQLHSIYWFPTLRWGTCIAEIARLKFSTRSTSAGQFRSVFVLTCESLEQEKESTLTWVSPTCIQQMLTVRWSQMLTYQRVLSKAFQATHQWVATKALLMEQHKRNLRMRKWPSLIQTS